MTRFSEKIAKASKTKKSSIILALDHRPGTSNLKSTTIKTIDMVSNYVCAIKINFHLLLPLSAREISEITKFAHSCGLMCIADIKLNDIGSTNEVALEHLVTMGFDAIIANPFMGLKTLSALVKRGLEMGAGVIALVYMSHDDAGEGYGLQAEYGMMHRIFLERAEKAGADGVVVGATQTDILKEVRGRLPIYSPGIGSQGGDIQKAVKSGSDYIIVGRSIVEASDPAKAAKEIQENARSARRL